MSASCRHAYQCGRALQGISREGVNLWLLGVPQIERHGTVCVFSRNTADVQLPLYTCMGKPVMPSVIDPQMHPCLSRGTAMGYIQTAQGRNQGVCPDISTVDGYPPFILVWPPGCCYQHFSYPGKAAILDSITLLGTQWDSFTPIVDIL